MDGNKDEALRCIKIAELALASNDKQRALKFMAIAKRMNPTIPLDHLLSACQNLDNNSNPQSQQHKPPHQKPPPTCSTSSGDGNNYTEEHVKLIRDIKRSRDYYSILGLEKTCSVDEIRKAYRKLSLKVHPDKNNAPGAGEAFAIVSKAFNCLSNEETRRQYDQVGFIEDGDFDNVRRRRRRATRNDYFEENFDADEIFRSFFFGNQGNVFRAQQVHRTRAAAAAAARQREHSAQGGGTNWILLMIQILPVLLFLLFAYLPFSGPYYSLQKTNSYHVLKVSEKHGIEYFVRPGDFDQKFPQGSLARDRLESNVVRDYRSLLGRYCHIEMQRRHWVRDFPTPHCDKLWKLGVS